MQQLQSQAIIITGGDSALGRVAAARAEREGARVVLINSGAPAGQAQAVEAAVHRLGGLHALVNVLPSEMSWAPFVQQAGADLARTLEGVQAVAAAMRAAYPHLVKTGGRVVNVGSIFGSTSFDQLSASVAADYALQGLTRALGVEWARDKIQVNHLAPAALDLPELRRFRESQPQRFDQRVAGLALRRLGDPDEAFGGALMFLLSDEACFLVGHTVHADGGQHLCAPLFEPAPGL